MPHGQKKKPKVSNRSNIVTDSIKTFKSWSVQRILKNVLKKRNESKNKFIKGSNGDIL